VGAALVAAGAALSVVALAGSPSQHVTDNANLEHWVWVNTHGDNTVSTVGTVGIPNIDVLPGDTVGSTVIGSPYPSINVTGGNSPGNTIVWFPGGAIVANSSTFVY
jgi:hypothetical protein